MRLHPELHGFSDKLVYQRVYWRKRGKENIAAGLTWNGEKRKRKERPDLKDIHGKKRKAITQRERAERLMAQGLTWRGTKRKRTKVNQQWKIFKKLEMNDKNDKHQIHVS